MLIAHAGTRYGGVTATQPRRMPIFDVGNALALYYDTAEDFTGKQQRWQYCPGEEADDEAWHDENCLRTD
jgi:hypothetical protein